MLLITVLLLILKTHYIFDFNISNKTSEQNLAARFLLLFVRSLLVLRFEWIHVFIYVSLALCYVSENIQIMIFLLLFCFL